MSPAGDPMTTADFPVLMTPLAFRRIDVTLSASFAATAEARFAIRQLGARIQMADYRHHGRTRPDGRPRRSGRRHRGMSAWSTRHG